MRRYLSERARVARNARQSRAYNRAYYWAHREAILAHKHALRVARRAHRGAVLTRLRARCAQETTA